MIVSAGGYLPRQERTEAYQQLLEEAIHAGNPDRASWAAGHILRLQELPPIPDVQSVVRATDHNREKLRVLRNSPPPTDPIEASNRLHEMQELTRQIAERVGSVRVDSSGLTAFTPHGALRLEATFPNTVAAIFRNHGYRRDEWFSQPAGYLPTEPLPTMPPLPSEDTSRLYPATRHDVRYDPIGRKH